MEGVVVVSRTVRIADSKMVMFKRGRRAVRGLLTYVAFFAIRYVRVLVRV